MTFHKILIANRGEIACRIIKTCQKMGIRTVAVFSSVDAQSLHVKSADEAFWIGEAPSAESYLRQDKILEVARQTGADAIHPGYGFLSENAKFAAACAEAGITFIGPPESAIIAMGSKSASKELMEEAGIPILPGYHGENQDPEFLKAEAEKIGFPLLIKASAGGGGKGMRIVESADQFQSALEGAQREGQASFSDAKVLLEKYITQPRHIEIQVFLDTHGNAVHLFERECSIQRRYQKVIEEAPSPVVDEKLRSKMGETAIGAALAIKYVGAGTVEFIMDENQNYYFMEMNTRLQVEHPVTEMITGQDLVEWQFRVASGAPLPRKQKELHIDGHSLEARIYAEDPSNNFLPATGTIHYWQPPEQSGHVRVDTGFQEGDEISMHYDPMLAKLIVWDEDRERAMRQMSRALESFKIGGTVTNIYFLNQVVRHRQFEAGELETGFIKKYETELIPPTPEPSHQVLALAALFQMSTLAQNDTQLQAADPHSPWDLRTGWRLNEPASDELLLLQNETEYRILITYHPQDPNLYTLNIEGELVNVRWRSFEKGILKAYVEKDFYQVNILHRGDQIELIHNGVTQRLVYRDPLNIEANVEADDNQLVAPMPGKVIQVKAKAGQKVKKGDTLMLLEVMKMEHTISAPADGVIQGVHFAEGEQVTEGSELMDFEMEEK